VRFELARKDASISLRLPAALLATLKADAAKANMPTQRLIRMMIEAQLAETGAEPAKNPRACADREPRGLILACPKAYRPKNVGTRKSLADCPTSCDATEISWNIPVARSATQESGGGGTRAHLAICLGTERAVIAASHSPPSRGLLYYCRIVDGERTLTLT
jgi:hypothetical protein